MKKILMVGLLACSSLSLTAGETAHDVITSASVSAPRKTIGEGHAVTNLSGILVGPYGWLSAHFDKRLKGNDGWGYDVGLGYAFSSSTSPFGNDDHWHMITLTPQMNYLLGKKKSKLELGAGMTLALVMGKTSLDYSGPYPSHRHITYEEHETYFGYYFVGTIGYRLQPRHGFSLRAGVSPVFGFGGEHSVDKFYLLPYLGFGFTF